MSGQTSSVPALERTLSVQVKNESVEEVLKIVSKKAQVVFSFNPELIDVKRKVTISVTNKSVRSILNLLFRNQPVEYKQKKQYIILSPLASKAELPKYLNISGYVYASADSSRLSESTVFDRTHQQAVLTDHFGYFTISLPADARHAQIKISKQNYQDTIVELKETGNGVLDVYLRPEYRVVPLSHYASSDTVLKFVSLPVPDSIKPPLGGFLNKWFVNSKLRANMRNLSDTVFSSVQLSLVPYVSTNRLLAGNAVNKVSFNLLAGYSNGVRIAEVGGLFNIDRGSVRYIQIAGLGNIVRDSVLGAQVATVYNRNGNYVQGAQVAGLFNNSQGLVKGAQVAGLINRSAYVKGAQVAGLINYDTTILGAQIAGLNNFSRKVEGAQIAGLINVNPEMKGFQAAGLGNFSQQIQGVQIAGLYNYSKHLRGLQIAGLYNESDTVRGVQVAGLYNRSQTANVQVAGIFNYSHSLRGFQLSVVNISDSANGIPLGLFSYVAKGYHKLEVFGDEVIYTQVAFRTGVEKLHNIFFVGAQPFESRYLLWSIGYGFGSSLRVSKNWYITVDATSQQIVRNGNMETSATQNKLFAGPEVRLSKKFSLAIGPVFNLLFAETNSVDYTEVFQSLAPYNLLNGPNTNNNALSLWIGGKISLKFF